ncbi:MAG: hypothetical protein ACI86M_000551 [Saprospiraceae bacterium]
MFADAHNLLELIPKINMTLARLDKGFSIITSNNEFKGVFPEISKLINFDFSAKNLCVDPLSKYILEMEYKGKVVGVEKTKLGNRHSLIEFLNPHLDKLGKKIYCFQYGAVWNSNYLYLKDDQKRGLERILGIRI